jgi:hypothetical protein
MSLCVTVTESKSTADIITHTAEVHLLQIHQTYASKQALTFLITKYILLYNSLKKCTGCPTRIITHVEQDTHITEFRQGFAISYEYMIITAPATDEQLSLNIPSSTEKNTVYMWQDSLLNHTL